MELDFNSIQLSGRDEELQRLQHAYQRACNPDLPAQVHIIRGDSGVGKSALVRLFLRSLQEGQEPNNRCAIMESKAGDYSTSSAKQQPPFSAFKDALRGLAEEFATDEEIRAGIQKEMSIPEIRALAAVLPGAENLLGTSCPSMDVSTSTRNHHQYILDHESGSLQMIKQDLDDNDYIDDRRDQWGLNRLRAAIRSLCRIVARNSTLVFFLDDLQWLDDASFKVLESMVLDEQTRHFLLIGTHRTPLPDDHSVYRLQKGVHNDSLTVVNLDNLSSQVVCRIVSKFLRREEDDVKELSDVIHKKTSGNAFFVIRMLRTMANQRMLYFNMGAHCRWEWDMDRILSETEITDNVLSAMSVDFESLSSKRLQTVLTTAACLGGMHFESDNLLRVLQESHDIDCCIEDLEELLQEAVKEGLVEKLSDPRKYKFAHDRIRESAYALLSNEEEKRRLHFYIGRVYRKLVYEVGHGSPESDRLLLLSAFHLNLGSDLILEEEEKHDLVTLNFLAAELAFQKSGFAHAAGYLQHAIDILGGSCFEHEYELGIRMTCRLAHMHFCQGDIIKTKAAIDKVLKHSRDFIDTLEVQRLLILILMQTGKSSEAFLWLKYVLGQLGIKVPREVFLPFRISACYFSVWRRLRRLSDVELATRPGARSIKDFNHRSSVNDPCQKIQRGSGQNEIQGFLALFAEMCWITRQPKYLAFGMLTKCKHGLEFPSSSDWALCLAGASYFRLTCGDMDGALKYGKAALGLALEGNYPDFDGRSICIVHSFVWHLRYPCQDSLDPLIKANQMLMDCGDVEMLGFSLWNYLEMYFQCGLALIPLREDFARGIEELEDYNQDHFVALLRPLAQLVDNLMGNGTAEDPTVLTGKFFDHSVFMQDNGNQSNVRLLQTVYRCRLFLCYYFGDIETAQEMSDELMKPEGPVPWLPLRYFFQGMTAFSYAGSTTNKAYKVHGKKFLRKLTDQLNASNPNVHHMVKLLEAENMATKKSVATDEVLRAFDRAIKSAGKSGILNCQALANERAGQFCSRIGDKEWAAIYLNRAYELYSEWGAAAKVQSIEKSYDNLIKVSNGTARGCGAFKAKSRLRESQSKAFSIF